MLLKLPTCFFGKYEDSHRLLVMQDVETMGFFVKTFQNKLNIAETKAVLRELARIQVASWGLEVQLDLPIISVFNFLVDPQLIVS